MLEVEPIDPLGHLIDIDCANNGPIKNRRRYRESADAAVEF
jgi:hypothetical protein